MNPAAAIRPANFTRTSPDLIANYLKSGRWHLIPLYWMLRQSDLAREGIERSGSYLFADHLYANVPSGRGIGPSWCWAGSRYTRPNDSMSHSGSIGSIWRAALL